MFTRNYSRFHYSDKLGDENSDHHNGFLFPRERKGTPCTLAKWLALEQADRKVTDWNPIARVGNCGPRLRGGCGELHGACGELRGVCGELRAAW